MENAPEPSREELAAVLRDFVFEQMGDQWRKVSSEEILEALRAETARLHADEALYEAAASIEDQRLRFGRALIEKMKQRQAALGVPGSLPKEEVGPLIDDLVREHFGSWTEEAVAMLSSWGFEVTQVDDLPSSPPD